MTTEELLKMRAQIADFVAAGKIEYMTVGGSGTWHRAHNVLAIDSENFYRIRPQPREMWIHKDAVVMRQGRPMQASMDDQYVHFREVIE